MTRPIQRRSIPTRVRENRTEIKEERRKPVLPEQFVYVGDYISRGNPGNDPPYTSLESPEWQNDFYYYDPAYVAFRHGVDGGLEFIGRLDLTLGAVTGTVAFTLPLRFRGHTFDYTFPIYAGGTDWVNGIMSIDGSVGGGTSGDVTVYWPVLADPI